MYNLLKKYNLIIISCLALFLCACEDVIDLKLDNTTPKIVIEGTITDVNEPHTVIISKTINFTESNKKLPVSGAVVVVKEEGGLSVSFTEKTPGVYVSPTFKGTSSKKYTISVTANGKVYNATSIMPKPVRIESLTQVDLNFFGTVRKYIQVNYVDPLGIPNFYNSRVFINNVKRDLFYVESDRFNDGKEVANTIFTDEPDLVAGNKVKIEFLTIDEKVYRYLFAITQIGGNGGPPTAPANPDSNFDNGALGYFSASTSRTESITVK